MATIYEWCIEECEHDIEGDIIDLNFSDSLEEYSSRDLGQIDQKQYQLVLLKNIYNDYEGLKRRYYAYAQIGTDGCLVLPEMFKEGTLVPKKFHAQLARVKIAVQR